MFIAFIVLLIGIWDRILSPWEALPLYALLAIFIYYNVHHVKNSNLNRQKEIQHIDTSRKTVGVNVLKFIAGAAGIVIGAELLVSNGTKIASSLGVSDGVIGVTVVALGTSLPELVTTVTALRKKESAMGIGNILGANILNFTMILSTCALISGGGLTIQLEYIPMLSRVMSRTLAVDMLVVGMLFMLLIVPPVIFKGRLKRLQGALMLAVYVCFIVFLVLNA
jgi:cation:H+ antiporter